MRVNTLLAGAPVLLDLVGQGVVASNVPSSTLLTYSLIRPKADKLMEETLACILEALIPMEVCKYQGP